VDLMLRHELIHGDLSPTNILYWARREASRPDDHHRLSRCLSAFQPQARFILRRDIERTCEYFVDQGCSVTARASPMSCGPYTEETDPEDLGGGLVEAAEMASPAAGC